MKGWIDVAQRTRLSGWAYRGSFDSDPVELSISAAATLIAPAQPICSVLANYYRPDHDPGHTLYEGRVGFDLDLRDYALPAETFLLDVRESATGMRVPGSPLLIPAASFQPAPNPMQLTHVDGFPVGLMPADVVVCPVAKDGQVSVAVPAGTSGVLVTAPARFVPGDTRLLGACLTAVAIDGVPVALDSEALQLGFHDPESDGGRVWRWMSGAAFIALGARSHDMVLVLDLFGVQPVVRKRDECTYGISGRYRFVDATRSQLPYIGSQFLARPISPPMRRQKVRARPAA